MATLPIKYNVADWINDNEKFFLPPVCNKMMHNTQLKVFYVGGPNQRKDYHLEEGEELFFMRKGDMTLKVFANGKFSDVDIKEGEVFLLPGKIPHSPQRSADTVGLVIERERLQTETDGLRYFVEERGLPTSNILFERWFYCDDLGSQLGPVIKEFFSSEQHKTGKPISEDILSNPPWTPDADRQLERPFLLKDWLDQHRIEISSNGTKRLFGNTYQSDIVMLGYGNGPRNITSTGGETFIWMIEGRSKICIGEKSFDLYPDDTLLVPSGMEFIFDPCDDAYALTVLMNPANKARANL